MTQMETIRCVCCGRFIPYSDMDPEKGPASFYFEPDNHFGPERSEWTCAKCSSPIMSDDQRGEA